MRINITTATADRLRHYGFNMGVTPTNPIHVEPGRERILLKGDVKNLFFPHYMNAGRDADVAINNILDGVEGVA